MPLDDITIATRFDLGNIVPTGMIQLPHIPGRPEMFGVARQNGILFVTYTPATRIVTLRISVPRWLAGHPVNFPLVPIASVEDLRPHQLARELAQALGVREAGDDLDELLPVRRMPVIRVSYALDLRFDDPVRIVQGLMGVERRNGGLFKPFGRPRITTVEWASKTLSAKFYAKGIQLLTERRRSRNETTNAVIEELASQAENVLRFEVTMKQVKAVRGLFGTRPGTRTPMLGTMLPTVALMCDPRIDGWVLTREAIRSRLNERYEGLDRVTFPVHVRHVVGRLRTAQASLAAGGRTLGRRGVLTPERVTRLFLTYVYASGFEVAEVADLLGLSVSSVRELVRELRELGIPPDGSPFATLGAAVRELAEQLDPHMLANIPPNLRDWNVRAAFVPGLWDEPVEEHDAVEDDPAEDVDVAGIDELLDEDSAVEDVGVHGPMPSDLPPWHVHYPRFNQASDPRG